MIMTGFAGPFDPDMQARASPGALARAVFTMPDDLTTAP